MKQNENNSKHSSLAHAKEQDRSRHVHVGEAKVVNLELYKQDKKLKLMDKIVKTTRSF